MDASYQVTLGNQQTAPVSMQNSLLTSNGTGIHKATVVIEPLAVHKPAVMSPTNVPKLDDEYSVSLGQQALADDSPFEAILIPSTSAQTEPAVAAAVETAPPVVWLAGGCSNSPAPAPALLNFELPISQTETQPEVFSILPLSTHKMLLEEPTVTRPESPVAPIEIAEPAEVIDETDTPTPKPDFTEAIDIALSNTGDKLAYSTTYTLVESRTTGVSPPVQSYAYSPETTPLSYSQAAHGASFAGPSSDGVHFGAETSVVSASYAGPSCSSSVPSYGGAVTSPVAYASSE